MVSISVRKETKRTSCAASRLQIKLSFRPEISFYKIGRNLSSIF